MWTSAQGGAEDQRMVRRPREGGGAAGRAGLGTRRPGGSVCARSRGGAARRSAGPRRDDRADRAVLWGSADAGAHLGRAEPGGVGGLVVALLLGLALGLDPFAVVLDLVLDRRAVPAQQRGDD